MSCLVFFPQRIPRKTVLWSAIFQHQMLCGYALLAFSTSVQASGYILISLAPSWMGGGGGKDKVSQRVEVRLYVKLPKMWGMGKKEIFLPISFSSFYITVNFKHGRDI